MLRCKTCGAEFEVSGYLLANPEAFLAWRDGLAEKHVCRPANPVRTVVRVLQFPTGDDLQRYFDGEMRRLIAAQF